MRFDFGDFAVNAGLYAPTSFSNPGRFMIISVDPRNCANFFSRNSLSTRVTVSRDVPISCAISSWVRETLIRMPSFVVSPSDAHSSSSRASFSPTECDNPSDRIIS